MRCPTCGKAAKTSPANRYRPFCSERCRLIDLGKWAEGSYRVPGKATDDNEHPADLVRKKTLH